MHYSLRSSLMHGVRVTCVLFSILSLLGGNLWAQADHGSLPDKVTFVKETKVMVTQEDGSPGGSAVLPKGASFTPTGIKGDQLTVKLQNGFATVPVSATDYKDAASQLDAEVAAAEAKVAVGTSITLEVQVGPKIPGGFLSTKRKTTKGIADENIAVVGLPHEQLKEGEWWRGAAKKLGEFTPEGSQETYFQYQATPIFKLKPLPPPGKNPNATKVTFAEIQKLYDSLNLNEWMSRTARVTNNINQRGGTYNIDAEDLLQLGIKREQIDYIRDSIPAWNQASETAQDWLSNRDVPTTYQQLLKLIIKANDLLGPNSIGTMRNVVNQIQTQWKTIETIDGPTAVPVPQ